MSTRFARITLVAAVCVTITAAWGACASAAQAPQLPQGQVESAEISG